MNRSRTREKSLGQVLAEFTLAIPLFMLVFLGIAEGGYYVVASTIVSNATHEGARLGVLADTTKSELQSRVVQSASAVAAIQSSDVRVCVNGTSSCSNGDYANRVAGDRLHVRTSYTHRPLVGYVLPVLAFDASAEAELWVEKDAP